MKWIVVLLLLANVAYATYQVTLNRPKVLPNASVEAPASGNETPAAGSELVLLGELDDSSLRPRAAASESPQSAKPSAAGATDTSLDTDQEPAPIAENVTQEPPKDESSAATTKVCIALGPLESPERVTKLVSWLNEQGAESNIKQNERREVSLFWVHIKPLPNRAAAKSKASDLETAGVADIYVITRGDMANAISLGVYKQEASMERRLKELQTKGVEAEVKPRYKTVTATWVEARLPAGQEIDEEAARAASKSQDLNAMPCAAAEIAAAARITYNFPSRRV